MNMALTLTGALVLATSAVTLASRPPKAGFDSLESPEVQKVKDHLDDIFVSNLRQQCQPAPAGNPQYCQLLKKQAEAEPNLKARLNQRG